MVAKEYYRICENEKKWRQVKHSLWWATVATHEQWGTHVTICWNDWQHLLGIAPYQQQEPRNVQLAVADVIVNGSMEDEILLRRPQMPGSFEPRP